MILKKIRNAIMVLTIALGGFVMVAPAVVAAPIDEICSGVAVAGGGTGCEPGEGPDVESVVGKVVNILSWVVGIIAVIMIIIGGIKYVTSSGDSNNINSAKNTILIAVVGLVVVALAQVVVRFVLNNVRG